MPVDPLEKNNNTPRQIRITPMETKRREPIVGNRKGEQHRATKNRLKIILIPG
jgi:hypothetical protein